MTDTVGPFSSTPWAQDQWYRHAPKWAPSGVNGSTAASTSTGDLPFTNSGLSVGVGNGRAWVRGAGFERAGGAVMQSVTANTNVTLDRRDRLVLRRDLAAQTLTPVVLLGTPSSNPTSPSVTQNETGQWDLPLFSWITPRNSGTALSDILDERAFIADGTADPAFASTRARDGANPSPVKGRRCSTADTGLRWEYTGTQWFATGWAGDDKTKQSTICLRNLSGTVNSSGSGATAFTNWPDVVDNGKALLTYVSNQYIQCNAAGRVRVEASVYSDGSTAGFSDMLVLYPAGGGSYFTQLEDKRQRATGYAGAGQLQQDLFAGPLVVQPGDQFGLSVMQLNAGGSSLGYQGFLAVTYV